MTQIAIVVCLRFNAGACIDGLARFKACIRSCTMVERVTEASGAFDMIVEGRCESLPDYERELARIQPQLTKYVVRVESSFVLDRSVHQADAAEFVLWLPCEHGRRRVDAATIDKVVAEGDYMRVHVGGWTCLVHQTMARLADQLPPGFIRLHRSMLVRASHIDRLMHHGRRWSVRLNDGSEVSVAQSHVRDLLRMAAPESSKANRYSTKNPVAGPTI